MEEKKVKLSNEKEYIVKEVKYKDIVAKASVNKEESAKVLLQSSTGLTDEEYDNLSMRDGIILQKAVNEVNGLDEDFLQAAPPKTDS